MTSLRTLMVGGTVAVLACYPSTTRPAFLPITAAPVTELELGIPQATRAVALQLDADSIPVRRTEPKDGWLESEWFDAHTLRPTSARPLGPGVVKVRAWIDPSRPDFSNVTIETVYRPLADPSRAPRELEMQVPDTNPAARRVQATIAKLAKQFGPKVDSTLTAAVDTVKHLVGNKHLPLDRAPMVRTDSAKPAAPADTTRPPVKPPVKDTTPPVRKPGHG